MKPVKRQNLPAVDITTTLVPAHAWVLAHLVTLREKQFYGELTIRLEAGSVTYMRTTETLKPPVPVGIGKTRPKRDR